RAATRARVKLSSCRAARAGADAGATMDRDDVANLLRQLELRRVEPRERRRERGNALVVARALVDDHAPLHPARALDAAQAAAHDRCERRPAGLQRLVRDLDVELFGGGLEQLEHDFWLHSKGHTI